MYRKLKYTTVLITLLVFVSQAVTSQTLNNARALGIDSELITSLTSNNKSLGGFKLVSREFIPDIKSTVYVYKHTKSGANLIYLENDSENKMMCINFRTPAKDNTGVNHVIEHSVLEGSKKYPVKGLINQLMKQSMSTYLNAYTTDNVTSYPVSSKNDKDFQNLISVYLNSVFYPNVLKDNRIFKQEGIRLELNSLQDELKYNGIVYNEMKGEYSSPKWILNKEIEKSLFPDTSYKYDSGGVPDNISDLTYNELINTYRNNYCPSNSYFYLYGKMDIENKLKFIGDNYLNKIPKKQVNTEIQLQKPFTEIVQKEVPYPAQSGTDTKNKTYLTLNYVIGKVTDDKLINSFDYIAELLGGLPSSPITKALKENGFGENVSVKFDADSVQPVLSITAQGINKNQKDKFKKVVETTLQTIVRDGIDKNLLDAVEKREKYIRSVMQGNYELQYNNLIMMSWIYGGEPTKYLNVNASYEYAKSNVQNLIKKYMLDNNHSSLVLLVPEPELEEKNQIELKEKLAKYKESMSESQLKNLINDTKKLRKWQEAPVSSNKLKTIPSLSLSDINKKVKEYKTIEKDDAEVKILEHPIDTNGVDIITMYFDTTTVPQDKLGYICLLKNILGNIGTNNYSAEKLEEQNMINGNMEFYINCIPKNGDNNSYSPKFSAQVSTTKDNLSSSLNLLKEIVLNSNLNDKYRLREVIKNIKLSIEESMLYSGDTVGALKVQSYMSEYGKYKNYNNYGIYPFICDLDKNFESKSDEIVNNLKEVKEEIFNKDGMIVSFIGDDDDYKSFSQHKFYGILSIFSDRKLPTYKYKFNNSTINEGIIIPSKVQYVFKGGELQKSQYMQNGKYEVLQNIINSYLWDNIRIKGGAYGAASSMNNGTILFYSYRDPNLNETLDVFDKIPNYLRKFNVSDRQMNNYIISAASNIDNRYNSASSVIGPAGDGIVADELYLKGVSQADLQKQRDELISTKKEDIREFADVIDKILEQNYICAVGESSKIIESNSKFNEVKRLLDFSVDKNDEW